MHEAGAKYVTVGIAGHVDHGKTSLVKCLTGIDTDRLQEEKRRNLSIESGVAPLTVNQDFQIALIDVPGHTDFLKNTIRGLSCVDMAILVVAADDGVMPQTLEHLEILKFLQVKTGFTVLSKADLVDDETLELAELEIGEVIRGTFLDGKPIVPFSAIDQRGLEEIRLLLEKESRNVPCKRINAPFRLCIDRVKSFAGFGTVATGTILSGAIREGDIVQILPSGYEARVRSMEVHHQRVNQAVAGQRAGINLPRITLEQVKTGMVLAHPGTISVSYLLNAELSMLHKGWKPLKDRQRVKLYLGTSVTNAMVVLMGRERLTPGEKCLVQLRLLEPVASQPGDPFVICSLNPKSIIGGGVILEVSRRKYRKAKCRDMVQYFNAIQRKDISAVVSHLLKQERNRLMEPNRIAREIGFPFEEVQKEFESRVKMKELLDFGDQNFFGNEAYQGFKRRIPEIVKKIFMENPYRSAVTAEEIKARLEPDLDDIPFKRMLFELCNEGKLVKKDKGFNYPGLSRFSRQQEELIKFILNFAQKSALVPFSLETAWKALNQARMAELSRTHFNPQNGCGTPMHKKRPGMLEHMEGGLFTVELDRKEVEKLFDYLCREGKLIRLNNGRFLSPWAMEEIKNRVIEVIKSKGALTLADSKEILGYGRTVGIPVLEYLDSMGITLRQGNVRVLRK